MTAARIDELRAKFEDNPRRYFAPLANEYRKAGDLTQAVELCREFLPNQPGHMSGHIVYGQALFESGDLDEARSVFETALELDPENLIALRHLGDIARARQELSVARRWYERVLEADPRNDDIAAQLAALAAQRRTPIAVPAIPEPEPVAFVPPAPAPLLDDELLADVAQMVEPDLPQGTDAPALSVGDVAAWESSAAVLQEFAVDLPSVSVPASEHASSTEGVMQHAADESIAAEPRSAEASFEVRDSADPWTETPVAASSATEWGHDRPTAEPDAHAWNAVNDAAGDDQLADGPSEFVVEPTEFAVESSPFAESPSEFAVESSPFAVEPSDVADEPSAFAVEPSEFATEPSADAATSQSSEHDAIAAEPIAAELLSVVEPPDAEATDDLDNPLPSDTPAAEPVVAEERQLSAVDSAAALTEALDALATWDVRDANPTAAEDSSALANAWADAEADDAALAGAWADAEANADAGRTSDAVAEQVTVPVSDFEAGFLAPEWPVGLEAVGPRTPARASEPVAPDEGIAATVFAESAAAEYVAPEAQLPTPELPTLAPRTLTDPWVSIVAANDASSDYTPIPVTPNTAMRTVEAMTAEALAGPAHPRLDGLETIDDMMSVTGEVQAVEVAVNATELTPTGVVTVGRPTSDDEPIVTETVAELYLQQGLTDRAMAVYRTLGARRPDDRALHERIARLEAEYAPAPAVAGRTAREWLAALAARQLSRRTPYSGTASVTTSEPEGGLASIFGDASDATDETAAQRWSDAYGDTAEQGATGDLFGAVAFGEGESATRVATPASAAPRVTPAVATAVNAGFSFDQFFTPPATPAPDAGAPSPDTQTAPDPAAPAEDLAHFAAWLRGLAS
jgi:hypothetical protein